MLVSYPLLMNTVYPNMRCFLKTEVCISLVLLLALLCLYGDVEGADFSPLFISFLYFLPLHAVFYFQILQLECYSQKGFIGFFKKNRKKV